MFRDVYNSLSLCQQPRRIATITIAHRVSAELNETCGETVGYKIRFRNEIGPRTKLIYATDGTLLREAINGSVLSFICAIYRRIVEVEEVCFSRSTFDEIQRRNSRRSSRKNRDYGRAFWHRSVGSREPEE